MHKLVNSWSSISTAHLQYCFLISISLLPFSLRMKHLSKIWVLMWNEQTKQNLVLCIFTARTGMLWNEMHYTFSHALEKFNGPRIWILLLTSGTPLVLVKHTQGTVNTHVSYVQNECAWMRTQLCRSRQQEMKSSHLPWPLNQSFIFKEWQFDIKNKLHSSIKDSSCVWRKRQDCPLMLPL